MTDSQDVKNTKKVLRENCQFTYKSKHISTVSVTLKTRQAWNGVFQPLKINAIKTAISKGCRDGSSVRITRHSSEDSGSVPRANMSVHNALS